jgi:hypothetical protein
VPIVHRDHISIIFDQGDRWGLVSVIGETCPTVPSWEHVPTPTPVIISPELIPLCFFIVMNTPVQGLCPSSFLPIHIQVDQMEVKKTSGFSIVGCVENTLRLRDVGRALGLDQQDITRLAKNNPKLVSVYPGYNEEHGVMLEEAGRMDTWNLDKLSDPKRTAIRNFAATLPRLNCTLDRGYVDADEIHVTSDHRRAEAHRRAETRVLAGQDAGTAKPGRQRKPCPAARNNKRKSGLGDRKMPKRRTTTAKPGGYQDADDEDWSNEAGRQSQSTSSDEEDESESSSDDRSPVVTQAWAPAGTVTSVLSWQCHEVVRQEIQRHGAEGQEDDYYLDAYGSHRLTLAASDVTKAMSRAFGRHQTESKCSHCRQLVHLANVAVVDRVSSSPRPALDILCRRCFRLAATTSFRRKTLRRVAPARLDAWLFRLDDVSQGVCSVCHDPERLLHLTGSWHVAHDDPDSRGGSRDLANVFPAHTDCNLDQGTRRLCVYQNDCELMVRGPVLPKMTIGGARALRRSILRGGAGA